MVDVLAICPVHGPFTNDSLIGGTGRVTFKSSFVSCPKCGRPSNIVDGTYDFIGDVLIAFRAPDVTLPKIEAFRQIVESVSRGTISPEEASQSAKALSLAFTPILEYANKNAGLLALLVAIVTLFVTVYAAYQA